MKYDDPKDCILKNITIDAKTSCWEWGLSKSNGYGRVGVGGRLFRAHRLSFMLLSQPHEMTNIPNGRYVLHSCDNRGCVNPTHLFLGTHQDNMDDMVKKGRRHKMVGSGFKHAKLKEGDIPAIRERCNQGEMQKDVARDYGVTASRISEIICGKRWTHV